MSVPVVSVYPAAPSTHDSDSRTIRRGQVADAQARRCGEEGKGGRQEGAKVGREQVEEDRRVDCGRPAGQSRALQEKP